MGATPAKFFPMPLPYGQSPDMGVLQQAKAAGPAPLNNFLPLNPQNPTQQQPAQPAPNPLQNQPGRDAMFRGAGINQFGNRRQGFYD